MPFLRKSSLLLTVTVLALGAASSAAALQCTKMPSSIDQHLQGVNKNMRQFTEKKGKQFRNDTVTVAFCGTVLSAYQGAEKAFHTCSCRQAIKNLCKVRTHHGVPEVEGPAGCATFAPFLL